MSSKPPINAKKYPTNALAAKSPPKQQTLASQRLFSGESSAIRRSGVLSASGSRATQRNSRRNAGNANNATRRNNTNAAGRSSSVLSSSGAHIVEPEDLTISRIKVLLKKGTTDDKEELNKLFTTINTSKAFDRLTKLQALTLDRLRNKPTLTPADITLYKRTLAVFGRPISSPFGSGTATAMSAAVPKINANTAAFQGAFTSSTAANVPTSRALGSNSSKPRRRPRSVSGTRSSIPSNTQTYSAPASIFPTIPTNRSSNEPFNYMPHTPDKPPQSQISQEVNTVRSSIYLKPPIAPSSSYTLPGTPTQNKSNESLTSSQNTKLSSTSGSTSEINSATHIVNEEESGKNNQGSSSVNMSGTEGESKSGSESTLPVSAATPPLPPSLPDLTILAQSVITGWRGLRENTKTMDSFISEVNILGNAIRDSPKKRKPKSITATDDANKVLKMALEAYGENNNEYDEIIKLERLAEYYIDAKTAPKEVAFNSLIDLAYLAAKANITLTNENINEGLTSLLTENLPDPNETVADFNKSSERDKINLLLMNINIALRILGYIRFQRSLDQAVDLGPWTAKLIDSLNNVKALIDANTKNTTNPITNTSAIDTTSTGGAILNLIIGKKNIKDTPKTFYDAILNKDTDTDTLVDAKKNLIALYIQKHFTADDIYSNPPSSSSSSSSSSSLSSSSSTQAENPVIEAANNVLTQYEALQEAISPSKNSSASLVPLDPAESIIRAKQELYSSISNLAGIVASNPRPARIPGGLRAIIDAAYSSPASSKVLTSEESESKYDELANTATLNNEKYNVLNELISSAVYSRQGLPTPGATEENSNTPEVGVTAPSGSTISGSSSITPEVGATASSGSPFSTSGQGAPASSTFTPNPTGSAALSSSSSAPSTSGGPSFDQRTLIITNFTEIVYPALKGLESSLGPMEPKAIAAITTLCGNLGATTTAVTTATSTATAFVPYNPTAIYKIEDSIALPIDNRKYLPISKYYRGPDNNINKTGIRLEYLLKKLVVPDTVLAKILEKQRGELKQSKTLNNKLYINSSDDIIQAIDYVINIPDTDPEAATRIASNSLKSTFIQSLYDLYQTYTLLVTQYTTYNKLTTDIQSNTNKLANTIIDNYLDNNGNGLIYTKTAAANAPDTVPTIKQRHYVALGLLNNVIKNATLAYLQFIKEGRQDLAYPMERIIAYLTHELHSFTTLVTTPETILVMLGGAETPRRKTLRRSKRVHKIEKDSSE